MAYVSTTGNDRGTKYEEKRVQQNRETTMNKWKRMVLAIVSLIVLMSTVGCWNYIEIEDMSIVAGVAIDKGASDGKLLVTAEIVDTKEGSKSSQAGFKMLSLTGETMFDIVR